MSAMDKKIPQAQSPHGKKNSTWCDLLIKKKSIESIWNIFFKLFSKHNLRIIKNNHAYNVKNSKMFFILSSATQNTSQKRTRMKINKYNKCLLIIVKVKWMFKKFNIKNIGGIHKFLFVFKT